MTAQVENATHGSVLHDLSGKFYSGMKREDVKNSSSLFFDLYKEFDRIDTNYDGVLSDSEIVSELNIDYSNCASAKKTYAGFGAAMSLIGMLTLKTASSRTNSLTLGWVLFNVYQVISANNKMKKIDKMLDEYYKKNLPEEKPETENPAVTDSVQADDSVKIMASES